MSHISCAIQFPVDGCVIFRYFTSSKYFYILKSFLDQLFPQVSIVQYALKPFADRFSIIGIDILRRIASHFIHRWYGACNYWSSDGLGFNDGHSESFVGGGENDHVGAFVFFEHLFVRNVDGVCVVYVVFFKGLELLLVEFSDDAQMAGYVF